MKGKKIEPTKIYCNLCHNRNVRIYKNKGIRYVVCSSCNSQLSIKPRKEHFAKRLNTAITKNERKS